MLPQLGGANRHGSCRWGMSMALVGLQSFKLFHDCGAIPQEYTDRITEGCRSWLWDGGTRLCSPIGMGGGSPSVAPPVSRARRSGRGMRPAGWNSRSPRKLSVVSTSEVGKMDSFPDGLVVKKNARVVSLSGDAEELLGQ